MKTVCGIWLLLLGLAVLAADFDLNGFLQTACRNQQNEAVLPDGVITVAGPVTLDQKFQNMVIRGGKGTMIVMKRWSHVFFLNGCKNITFRDFSVDYDPLPFTQATVTAMEGNIIRYRIHDGYPDLRPEFLVHHPQFFDRESRNFKWDKTNWSQCRDNRMLGKREGELEMVEIQNNLAPGDFVVLNYRPDSVIKIRNLSENIVFENLTFYSSPGGGIFARRSAGLHEIRNVKMIRGATPAGAAEPRLLALGADGVNYATCRQGPLVEHCEFAYLGDDSVNFHGSPMRVVKVDHDSFYAAVGYRPTEYLQLIQAGDPVRFLAKDNYQILRQGQIMQVEIAPDIPNLDKRMIYPPGSIPEYMILRVKTASNELPEVGSTVDFPRLNSPGYVIRNNYFHDHRARGLRLMGYTGLVEGNRIANLEQAAISVGPEYGYWLEGGWVDGVTVQNNEIRDVMQSAICGGAHTYSLGAVCTFVANERGSASVYPGNRNVSIINNQIDGSGMAGIYILAADGVRVENNQIRNVLQVNRRKTGSNYGITFDARAIGVSDSVNVQIKNNQVE